MNEHERLQRAVDGEVTAQEQREVEDLLRRRPDLAEEMEELRAFQSLWTDGAAPEEDPEAADALARRLWSRRDAPRRRPRRRAWLAPAAALAAGLALVLLHRSSPAPLPPGWQASTPVRTPAELAPARSEAGTTLDLGSFHGEAGPSRGE